MSDVVSQLSYAEFLDLFPEFTGEISERKFLFLTQVLECQYDCLGLDRCGDPANLFYLLIAHSQWLLMNPGGALKSVKNANSQDVFNVAQTTVDDLSLSQSVYGRLILDLKLSCYRGVPITGC
jgi:hypothetical protein